MRFDTNFLPRGALSLQAFNTRPDKYLENVQAGTISHKERLRCPGGFFFFSFVSNICDPLNPAKEMRSSAALLWLAFGARRERWLGRG